MAFFFGLVGWCRYLVLLIVPATPFRGTGCRYRMSDSDSLVERSSIAVVMVFAPSDASHAVEDAEERSEVRQQVRIV